MKQVFIIHGGNSFSSHEAYIRELQSSTVDYGRIKAGESWRQWIAGQMPRADVLTPEFPNKQNAQFDEWKIYFEKLIPFFGDDVRLVGHSLGAMFLAKYLHDTPLPRKVRQLVLVAGGYSDDTNEDIGSFAVTSATGLEASAEEIHLFHSKNDPVVPFTELTYYQQDLATAISHVYEDKFHFWDSTFPELLEILKQK